jgi:hypothetical protein
MGKSRLPLRPTYNSPVILTFALAACVIMAVDGLSGGRLTPRFIAT